jgi:hypothetical protein
MISDAYTTEMDKGEDEIALIVKEEASGGANPALPKKNSKTKNDLRRGSN